MLLVPRIRSCSTRIIPPAKANEVQQIYQFRQRIPYHGESQYLYSSSLQWSVLLISIRVEKYRPDTLEDVQGHQDILATINKFIESNACLPARFTVPES